MRETSASEPLPKHRKRFRWHQNRGLDDAPGRAGRLPTYWPCGVRCAGGVTLILAFARNVRTWPAMLREKAQVAKTTRLKVPMRRRGADCLVLVMKRGNARGAKGAGHRRLDWVNRQRDEPDIRWKAAAFMRWHEPDDARVSSPESVRGSGCNSPGLLGGSARSRGRSRREY